MLVTVLGAARPDDCSNLWMIFIVENYIVNIIMDLM